MKKKRDSELSTASMLWIESDSVAPVYKHKSVHCRQFRSVRVRGPDEKLKVQKHEGLHIELGLAVKSDNSVPKRSSGRFDADSNFLR